MSTTATDPDLVRAQAYWDEQWAIWEQQRAGLLLLAGDPAAAQRVWNAWWPYLRWRDDRNAAAADPVDPLAPPMPLYPL